MALLIRFLKRNRMSDLVTDYPHLSKAPILEAVIDFRVKLPSDVKLDSFQAVRSQLAKAIQDLKSNKSYSKC